MVGLRELAFYVAGALRLARLDTGGLDHFDNTAAAFWRSFHAALYVAPFFAYLTVLQFEGVTVRSGPAEIAIVESLMYVIGWLLFPFVMMGITAALDRRDRYCRYIAAYNWSTVVWISFFFAVVVMRETEVLPATLMMVVLWTARLLMFAYAAYIARAALDVTVAAAIGIVVIDFVLAVVMDGITASMLGIRYAPG